MHTLSQTFFRQRPAYTARRAGDNGYFPFKVLHVVLLLKGSSIT
jgi:hypothetical protein